MSTAIEAVRENLQTSCDLMGIVVPELTDAEIREAIDAEELGARVGSHLAKTLHTIKEDALRFAMKEEASRLDRLEARCEALETRCSDLAARQHVTHVHPSTANVEVKPEIHAHAGETNVRHVLEMPPMETEMVYDGEGKDRRIKGTRQRKAKS